jgi:uncharacterized protein (TIGR02594 family)
MNRALTVPEMMLKEASKYIGLQEISGDKHNPVILKMFDAIGQSWVKDDETAWCSCFVNYIALKLNLTRSNKLNAKSWLDVATSIKSPQVGDIVVFWRENQYSWKGHVGIFSGYDKNGDIYCLGGNQGNEVCISVYPKERLLGFRRLFRLK